MARKTRQSSKANVEAKDSGSGEKYIFLLFVTGMLPNSARAIVNARAICEKYLKGKYELEIIDIYQQPALALKEDIIAIPVLIKKFPLPEIRLVGDLSDTQGVLEAFSLLINAGSYT